MKRFLKPAILPFFTLGASVIGVALRLWLMLGGTDEKGLFLAGHPAQILLWVLTALVLALLFLLTGSLSKAPKYSYNYPPSVVGAVGAGAAALGVLLTSIRELSAGGDLLAGICAGMGLLCTTLLAVIALARWKGYRFNVLLHGAVCVYAMLHLVCKYRVWSSEPQLLSYCFSLFCLAALAVSVFCRAGFDADSGSRRSLVISHLAAVFFGLVAIPGNPDWIFYFTVSLWMLTDLCNLTPAASNCKE